MTSTPETIESSAAEKKHANEALLPVVIDMEAAISEITQIAKGKDIPDDDRAILCMRAYGMSERSIAEVLGIHKATVAKIIKLYDPDRKLRLPHHIRLAFVRDQLSSVAVEALAGITVSDIKKLPVMSKLSLARIAVQAIQAIGDRVNKRTKIGDVLQYARKAVEEGALEVQ